MSTAIQLAHLSPGGNLGAYIQAVNSIPILSAERERMLAENLYYRENLEAARELVMSHLRFVVHIARSYTGYGLPLADLIQEGNLGLMKATRRFNPEKNVRLVSFAVHWIKAEIHEYVLRNWRIVKVATTKAQRKLFFNLRKAKKKLAWFSHDEANNVAEDLGVDVGELRAMEGRLAAVDMSFDVAEDDEQNSAVAPRHHLHDASLNPEKLLADNSWWHASLNKLHATLEKLDERSRHILKSRWLQEKKATLHELADQYGISPERIRQIEQQAMKKLATLMAGSDVAAGLAAEAE